MLPKLQLHECIILLIVFLRTTLIKEETSEKCMILGRWSLVVLSLHEKDAMTKLLRDKPKQSWFNEREIK